MVTISLYDDKKKKKKKYSQNQYIIIANIINWN